MSDPMKQLPTLEQVARRVALMHQELSLCKAVLESHRAQIDTLINEDLLSNIAELNLQMKFLMRFFTVTTQAPLVGPDGQRQKIVRTLGEKYADDREQLLARLEEELNAQGVDEAQPAEGNGSAPAEDISGADALGLLNGNPPNGHTH